MEKKLKYVHIFSIFIHSFLDRSPLLYTQDIVLDLGLNHIL